MLVFEGMLSEALKIIWSDIFLIFDSSCSVCTIVIKHVVIRAAEIND